MSENSKKDIRIIRTNKALISSMSALLSRQRFEKITVHDLCEKAFISRAAFYAHFNDKYALLDYWLKKARESFASQLHETTPEQTEVKVNNFVKVNSRIIINLIDGADSEVLSMVEDFISYILGVYVKTNEKANPNHIVLNKFCAGGIVSLLIWQIKSMGAQSRQPFNSYFFGMLSHLAEWNEA